jgi:hypothetical protein
MPISAESRGQGDRREAEMTGLCLQYEPDPGLPG